MLIDNTLFGIINKVEIALERIDMLCPDNEKSYVAFSGGKDSQVIYDLMLRSGKPFDAHFNVTTVDPPELCKFIRKNYPEVIWDFPKISMKNLIIKNMIAPTRNARFCCKELKEGGGKGRFTILGIRREESVKRSKRKMVESCPTKGKRILNPIIDWSELDVWEYIKTRKLPYCSLYDEGFNRIGCVMCPLSGSKKMKRDAKRWPGIYRMYLKAFDLAIKRREEKGLSSIYKSGQEQMDWWLNNSNKKKTDKNQTIMMFDN